MMAVGIELGDFNQAPYQALILYDTNMCHKATYHLSENRLEKANE